MMLRLRTWTVLGSEATCTSVDATCWTSNVASVLTLPSACVHPASIPLVMSVLALPMCKRVRSTVGLHSRIETSANWNHRH